MFSIEFEIIICIALAVVTVLLFLGKGDFMLNSKGAVNTRTPEEQLKFSRGMSCFTGVWLITELGVIFLGKAKWFMPVYLVVLVGTFVALVFYSKKHSS